VTTVHDEYMEKIITKNQTVMVSEVDFLFMWHVRLHEGGCIYKDTFRYVK